MKMFSLTLWSFLDTIIKLPLIFSVENSCKSTNSSYIICLKTILKTNRLPEEVPPRCSIGLTQVLKSRDMFVLRPNLITIFVTIQHNVFSETVLSLLRHEAQCFKLILLYRAWNKKFILTSHAIGCAKKKLLQN